MTRASRASVWDADIPVAGWAGVTGLTGLAGLTGLHLLRRARVQDNCRRPVVLPSYFVPAACQDGAVSAVSPVTERDAPDRPDLPEPQTFLASSMPSSVRRPRPSVARCASSPGRVPARPGRLPIASRSRSVPALSPRPTCWLVTFTTRAAGELRGRLRGLGVGTVQARTFHSAALRQLQYFWPRTVGGELPAILKSKVPLLAEVAGRLRLGLSSSDLRDVATEIEWMKALQRPPDDYASSVLARAPHCAAAVTDVTALYAGYEDLKVRKNQFDFEDLLLACDRTFRDRARRRGPGARAVPVLRRRRVPGRQPRSAAAARRVARQPRRSVRCRRSRADHLLLRRRLTRLPHFVRYALPEGDRRTARSRLPIDATGRVDRQPVVGRVPGRPTAPGASTDDRQLRRRGG